MSAITASILNNFADLALSLPPQTLEATIKQNPTLADSTGYDGRTALQKAVYMNNIQVAKLLLQNGADPNFRSNSAGETAVHLACQRGGLKSLVLLLKHGGDISLGDDNGRIAVHSAAYAGSVLLMQYLSEVCDVNLEAQDNFGATPLHIAASSGHLELVKYLVTNKNVSKAIRDKEGNLPIHCGACSGQSGVTWLLIYPDEYKSLTDNNHAGQTPLQLSQSATNISPDCRKWLEKWTQSAKQNKPPESPRWTWLFHLLLPFFLGHSAIVLSYTTTPRHQWVMSGPIVILLLVILLKQNHRLRHPSRLPNPIYLGCYVAGLISTITCALFVVQIPLHLPVVITLLILWLIAFHCSLIFKLLKGDPGRVTNDIPLKEVLRGVGEELVKGYCVHCQLPTPPLSHHCRLCETCYHHMDHHCLFLNCCIAAQNHWYFVVFIATNFILQLTFVALTYLVSPPGLSSFTGIEYLEKWIIYLFEDSSWRFYLVISNFVSAMWAGKLFKIQFNVITTQQTTVCRLKLGPTANTNMKEKLRNFKNFLLHQKVVISNQNHYFQQV